MAEKKFGRKKRLTPEGLLQAIRETASVETFTLAKHTGVERTTVWRRMKELSEDQIKAVLTEVAEDELKPGETQYEVFLKLPDIAEAEAKMNGRISPKWIKTVLRTVHFCCVTLNKKPSKLTPEDVADLIEKCRRGEFKKSPRSIRHHMRSWFQKQGISAQKLTSLGIESIPLKKDKKRARTRLTPQQRVDFMHALEDFCRDMPDTEKCQWLILPKYLYYTGTRIAAALTGTIEDIDKTPVIWYHNIKDKGKWKKGRQEWRKKLTGELKDLVARMLEIRGVQEGLLFDIYNHGTKTLTRVQKVRDVFKLCYQKAGIPKSTYATMPCHIWRHTACQDLLDSTNRNHEKVASILGWESVDTMKQHYGLASEEDEDKVLLEAMGIEVEWEKKEFKF